MTDPHEHDCSICGEAFACELEACGEELEPPPLDEAADVPICAECAKAIEPTDEEKETEP